MIEVEPLSENAEMLVLQKISVAPEVEPELEPEYIAPLPTLNRHKTSYHEEEEERAANLWLVTFTDVVALMLTFFVLMYAMSAPKEEAWKKMAEGAKTAPAKQARLTGFEGTQEGGSLDKISFAPALNLNYLKTLWGEILAEDARLERVVLKTRENALVLSLPEDLLFDSAGGRISAKGQDVLLTMGAGLARIRNRIEIVAYVDSRWDLSLARARAVMQALQNGGYTRSVTVRGKIGHPRLEILIMKDGG